MALSRAEIELLIKARNEAQGAFDQLNKQVKTVTGETDKATEGMDRLGKKTQGTGLAAGAAGGAFVLLAERVGRGLVSAFQESIAAANRLDSGLIGLRSVATAFSQDAGIAESAAKKLAADGLLSVGEAATSLKNLLAAGFGLPEAVTLVERFKDSAAFGRQASLDFGQAVSSATEGIKNGNSILVDNAGVTKNLSNILVEAGFAATDLSKASSDASIRMALFNGIVKETNPQLGDAARYLDTAAGKQAQFNAQVDIAQQKIGKALQPALAAALGALVPFVEVIGEASSVLVPLGAGLAGVVAPIAAIKAASALGINSLADLRGAFTLTTGSAETASRALQAVSLAQKGLFVAGVVTAAYQAAKGLGDYAVSAREAANESGEFADQAKAVALELASFTNPVSAMVVSFKEWREAMGLARESLARLTGTATVDLPRIKDATGEVVGSMGPFQTAAEKATRALAFQPKTFADIRALQSEFTSAGQAAETSRARLESWRSEITAATGRGALPELRNQMQLGVLSTKELSEMFHISEGAIKFYETSLKQASTATKQHEKDQAALERETRKGEQAQHALRTALEQTAGVLTQQGLNEQLMRLDDLLKAASGQGSPALQTAVRNLNAEFAILRQKALDSGLAVEGLDASFTRASASAGRLAEAGFEKATDRGIELFAQLGTGIQQVDFASIEARHNAERLTGAYRTFGLSTPQELQRVADAARASYEILLASGTATTEQLQIAYRRMVEAQVGYTKRLPTEWDVAAANIKRTLASLYSEVTGNLSSLILGLGHDMDGSLRRTANEATNTYLQIKADGTATPKQIASAFQSMQEAVDRANYTIGERFEDVWRRMKVSALNVLDDVLEAFVNRFLKGLLGAMSGQQGAFSSAFAGLFGGAGTAGGPAFGGGPFGNGGILGGLFGGGAPVGLTGAGSSPSIAAAGLGFPGGGGAAGAGGLGAGAAGLLGGLGAGAAGVGLGFLGKELFGGAGYKAAGFGAGSGAATGALIGSVVPGLGTAVGAIIGGLAGAISGALGKTQGMKTNDARDKFLAQFGGSGTGEGSGFLTLAQQLSEKTGEAGGGGLFNALTKAKDLKALEQAIQAIVAKLQEVKPAADAAGDATTGAAQEGTAEADKLGDQWRDQIQTVQRLKDQAVRLEEGFEAVGDQDAGVFGLSTSLEILYNKIAAAEAKAADLAAAMRAIPGAPVGSGSTEIPIVEGGAAGGVFANRPGLVLFGEGGEQEVGGPKSFFKQVFEELGVAGGGVGGGGGVVNLSVNIQAIDGASVRTVFESQIVPMLKEALRGNIGGLQSDFRALVK